MNNSVIDKITPNVVRIDVSLNGINGNGTGLLIDKKGTILTCAHVIQPEGIDADSIKIVRDKEYDPEIIKLDADSDIAILRVKNLEGHADFLNYNEVHMGEDCFIAGYPLRLSHLSLSKGTISAKGKWLGTKFPFELFQIDARINYGNSGGPVYQASTGKVIGIVTAKYIPFLTQVDELRNFVRTIPQMPLDPHVVIQGINIGAFFNYVNESVRLISDSLMLVQVGIGWVIPIERVLRFMEN